MRPTAVVARGLGRRSGRRPVLDRLDLEIGVGARVLVVSHPEETARQLLRVLAGLLRPHAGSYRLAGLQRADDSPLGWARRVAYVPAETGIYPWLSPREVLRLAVRLAGYDDEEGSRRVEACVTRFRLEPDLDRPISRGGAPLEQRVALAAALLTDPEVILLEDPLRSLEAAERSRLLRLRGQRRTVLLASRYPASEAGLVNQVILLDAGRVALHADVAALDHHGLPLSLRGIEALAELRASGAA
jgi:ABC-2 type transport system ATP-binding protein